MFAAIKRLSIAKKLHGGFGLVLLLTIFVGVFAVWELQDIDHVSAEVTDKWLPSTRIIGDIHSSVGDLMKAELRHLISADDDEKKRWDKEIKETLGEINEHIKAYAALPLNDDEKKALDDFKKAWSLFLMEHEVVIVLSRQGEFEDARDVLEDTLHLRLEEVNKLLEGFLAYNAKHGTEASDHVEKTFFRARFFITALVLAAGLLGAVLAFLITRSITGPLRRVMKGIATGSDNVAAAAHQIASSSEELSQAATEQASSLQETAASAQELHSMVTRNSENAKSSAVCAETSHASAVRGKQAVERMIEAITEINASNSAIGKQTGEGYQDIQGITKVIAEIANRTKVINEIVFQTKLLSFNASVEAARAGEQGKGFAVVAEEVGKLAQMSGNSAREIEAMLGESIKKVESIVNSSRSKVEHLIISGRATVEEGQRIALECGQALDEIVTHASSSTRMAEDISSASNEQASGINEINRAVAVLDQVTQQNASTAEEAASASEELSGQAEMLRSLVEELVGTVEGSSRRPTIQPAAKLEPASAARKPAEVLELKKTA